MMRLIARRLAHTLVLCALTATATFALAELVPADPARVAAGPAADERTVSQLRHAMGLDRSRLTQYWIFVTRLAHGDLGTSLRTGRPVRDLVRERAGASAQLIASAFLLEPVLGLPLGLLIASRRRRGAAALATAWESIALAAPVFWIGPLLLYFLAYRLGWLPIGGAGTGGLDRLRHLVLPAATLALAGAAAFARVCRGELAELAGEPFARAARAKGLGRTAVLLRLLRCALGPLIALGGLELAALLSGAVATEWIFDWPGLVREAVMAIADLDLPVLLAITLLSTVLVALASLLADLAHVAFDPRLACADDPTLR
jgi:peptide/nickel transport system permease protein